MYSANFLDPSVYSTSMRWSTSTSRAFLTWPLSMAVTTSEVSTWRGPVTSETRLLPMSSSSVAIRIQKIGPRRKRFTSILARVTPTVARAVRAHPSPHPPAGPHARMKKLHRTADTGSRGSRWAYGLTGC